MKKIYVFLCILFCTVVQVYSQTYTNPVIGSDSPDPGIIYDESTHSYYVITTDRHAWMSQDLVNWTETTITINDGGMFWAPEIRKRRKDGLFYMTYTLNGNNIYLAKSSSITGPYTRVGGPYYSNWAIDNDYFEDDDGKEYMFFATGPDCPQGEAGVYVADLSSDLTSISNVTQCVTQHYPVYQSFHTEGITEAPYCIKHNGIYYLLYSANGYGVNYTVCYATASNPHGPWTKYPENPIIYRKPDVLGPGHCSVTTSPDGSQLFICYHMWNSTTTTDFRRMCIDKLWFESNSAGEPDILKVDFSPRDSRPYPLSGLPLSNTTVWNFNTDLEGWSLMNHLTGSVENGYLNLTVTGNDPYMISPDNLNIDASQYKYMIVRMRNMTSDNTAQLYWITTTDNVYNEAKHMNITIKPNDSQYSDYIIDLRGHSGWNGTIKQIRLDPVANASSGTLSIDFIKLSGSYPSAGQLHEIPGTIEAEDFNLGGAENAYHDNDVVNNGGKYRTGEQVDIESCGDTGGGYNIGWIQDGEWTEYLVEVSKTTKYLCKIRTSSLSTGGNIRVYVDGNDLTGSLTVPVTGAWQSYTDVTSEINLDAGIHLLRLYYESGAYNINKITFSELTVWNFNTDLEGWSLMNHLTGSVENGYLNLTVTGNDPYMISPDNLNIDASQYKYVIVRMHNMTSDNTAQLYWITTTDNVYNEAKHMNITINPNDSQFSDYIIDLRGHSGWNGTIKQIRLDPVANVSSGTLSIDFIKLSGSYPSNVKKTSSEDVFREMSYGSMSSLLRINPNPANKYIEISGFQSISHQEAIDIHIIDMLGHTVFHDRIPVSTNAYMVNMSVLTEGIYFVKVGNQVQKIIVVHH